MPRQRSKKLSSSRKDEEQSIPELQRPEVEDESDNESLGMLEKDSDEEELDRLVLGDDAGFMAQLGGDMEIDEDESEDSTGVVEETGDEEDGLEGVNDEDVRITTLLLLTEADVYQAFFPRFWTIHRS